MVSVIVKDVFKKGFVSVLENDTLSGCLSLFREEMPPVLVVLDEKGKYKGALARRWIVRSRLDPSITKVKTLMRSAPKLVLHDSVSKAARLMIGSEIRQLPVFDGEKLVGFVTDEDIIHKTVSEEWGKNPVERIITRRLFFVEEEESVGAVLSLFREQGISHVPVVNKGKLVGMISIHDIIEHIFQPKQSQTRGETTGEKVQPLSIPAKGIMTKPVITISSKISLKDAVKKMHKFNVSSLVIVGKGRPLGIVTKRDFLEPLAQTERAKQTLTLQFSNRKVELNDIQRSLIMDDFRSFSQRYEKVLEFGTLFVYMKTHGTNYKGDKLIHCRLKLRTEKGLFFSTNEGWNTEQTFRIALDRLERQILRSKEFEKKREFAQTYFQRIQFPLTEL